MNNCIYFFCNCGLLLHIRAKVSITYTLENSVIPVHTAKSILWHHIIVNENLKGCLWKQRTHKRTNFGDCLLKQTVREKSRECHNHKPQPFPDPMRKRKPTNPNKHKSNKSTKSTKISSLSPKRGNRNTKRTEKTQEQMTHGKTYNKSPRRINHKARKSKTNTGTTALERSVE